jgi:integrase/recombinase XerD
MPRKRIGPRMYRRDGRRGWWCSFSDREKHIPLAGGAEDEAQAAADFAQRVAQRQGRVDLAPDERSLVELWATLRERAATNNTPKTAYELHLNVRRVLAWLEERQIVSARQVDAQIVEDYKTARRFAQVSAARINRELDSWRRLMKLAVEEQVVSPSALSAFAKLREPRPEPHQRGLTRAELTRFFKVVDHPGYRAMFRLALGSGLRDEELRHLEAGDVRKQQIVVSPKPGWTTKGYRYRSIWVSPATLKAAKAFLAARPWINLDKKRVWTLIQQWCKRAKVSPAFSLQDLRRAWASHLMLSGEWDLKTISAMLGHAEVATTERYLRLVRPETRPGRLPW